MMCCFGRWGLSSKQTRIFASALVRLVPIFFLNVLLALLKNPGLVSSSVSSLSFLFSSTLSPSSSESSRSSISWQFSSWPASPTWREVSSESPQLSSRIKHHCHHNHDLFSAVFSHFEHEFHRNYHNVHHHINNTDNNIITIVTKLFSCPFPPTLNASFIIVLRFRLLCCRILVLRIREIYNLLWRMSSSLLKMFKFFWYKNRMKYHLRKRSLKAKRLAPVIPSLWLLTLLGLLERLDCILKML